MFLHPKTLRFPFELPYKFLIFGSNFTRK